MKGHGVRIPIYILHVQKKLETSNFHTEPLVGKPGSRLSGLYNLTYITNFKTS